MPKAKPWNAREDALLGTDSDRAIARRLNRDWRAVNQRRLRLGIAPFADPQQLPKWGATELGMLGRYADHYIARLTGRAVAEVKAKRLAGR